MKKCKNTLVKFLSFTIALILGFGNIAVFASNVYDINTDGTVNTKDLTRLMKLIAIGESSLNYDVNGDNLVSTKDLTRLMKYIASGETGEINAKYKANFRTLANWMTDNSEWVDSLGAYRENRYWYDDVGSYFSITISYYPESGDIMMSHFVHCNDINLNSYDLSDQIAIFLYYDDFNYTNPKLRYIYGGDNIEPNDNGIRVEGYISPKTFSSNSTLIYDTLQNGNWTEQSILDGAKMRLVDMLDSISVLLDEINCGVTLEDLGFLSFNK